MMEVDSMDSWNSNPPDGAKFANLKAFVNAAREFEATHSDSAINMMTRYLGLIASSCDLSIFSPGRSEVCAFFSSLWRVMNDGRGPHWAGVAVLARACIEPSAKHALTHTYKFMPILARLLSDSISNDKKIKLLSVMEEISYGIKISWQESYLSGLMRQLTEWVQRGGAACGGRHALAVLVNLCHGNLPAVYALVRAVDTKAFVRHLVGLKDGGYGGVEVCRLLLCLSGATRGARPPDVTHSYLACTLKTFGKALIERDGTQLLHAHALVSELVSTPTLRAHVLAYPDLCTPLQDALQHVEALCGGAEGAQGEDEAEGVAAALRSALKFLTVIVELELSSLRSLHASLAGLSLRAGRVCAPDALELLAAVLQHYRSEGELPAGVCAALGEGLPALLEPPTLEPARAGLQWLQAVCALCESGEASRVLRHVPPAAFEDALYAVLQHAAQGGAAGAEAGVRCAVLACRAMLSLAPLAQLWDAAFNRMLAHHQVRRQLCAALGGGGARRRQVLQLVKHHAFPADRLHLIFGESPGGAEPDISSEGMGVGMGSGVGVGAEAEGAWERLSPAQEQAVDQLLQRMHDAMHDGKISDVATSSVMELYGYKMTCLEQRLHSHAVALQGATEHMASLQHALALLQATNSQQQDVLYSTQTHNERLKKTIEDLHRQVEDAEKTLQSFRAKLAGERLDKENQRESLQKEFRAQVAKMETEMRAREKELEDRCKQLETDNRTLAHKLEQQSAKNGELAGVLVKFEERVKMKERRLEEAAAADAALRRDLDARDLTIKQLEKTVLERENRLYQLSAQLEDMKRVQEMVADLMRKSASAANTPAS